LSDFAQCPVSVRLKVRAQSTPGELQFVENGGTRRTEETLELIEFLRRHLMSDWADASRVPDSSHPHRRRYLPAYRRKRSICKSIWIVSGLLMIAQGTPQGVIALGLGTTFLCFMILDETG
jgi:hypothetical protein